jgi:molecular chaperone GrpE
MTRSDPSKEKHSAPAEPKPAAQPSDPVPPAPVDDKLEAARKEAAEAHDRHLRAVADLENFKRRTIREKEDLRLYGASRILEDLLPVLDNLSLGLAAARQPNAVLGTLVGGVEMVGQQLKSALAAHGLKEISPAGQPFDPHQHEAMSHEASATVPVEHVISTVRSGYSLNGRLLRPAAVVVSSGPAASKA